MRDTLEQVVKSNVAPSAKEVMSWKHFVDDHTRIEELASEMPYLAMALGKHATNVNILAAADNDAGSYKFRGAFNSARIAKDQGARAVSLASAANFGAGGIYAAQYYGLQPKVFVPKSTPDTTQKWLKGLGPNGYVMLDTFSADVDEATTRAREYADCDANTSFMHPFDSQETLQGQGTIVDDLLRSDQDTQQIVLPGGGGGLMSGVGKRLIELDRQDITLMVAQADGSNSLESSHHDKQVVEATAPNPLFRGACVRRSGTVCNRELLQYPNVQYCTVTDQEVRDVASLYIEQNHDLLREDVPMYEPTSLLAFTALLHIDLSCKTVVIGTGTNQHPSSLFAPSDTYARRTPRLSYGPDQQK